MLVGQKLKMAVIQKKSWENKGKRTRPIQIAKVIQECTKCIFD
jgi:hypothetical protein